MAGLAGAIGAGYLLHGVADACVAAALLAVGATASPWLLGALVLVPRFAATLLSATLKIWVAVAIDRLSGPPLLALAVLGSTGLLLGPFGGFLSGFATSQALQSSSVATITQWQQLVSLSSAFVWLDRVTLAGVLVYAFLRSR